MQNLLGGFNCRAQMMEERNSEFVDRLIEIILAEKQREKKVNIIINKASETCESILKDLICISLVSQKKRRKIFVQNKYLNNGRNFPKFGERHIFKDSRNSVNP